LIRLSLIFILLHLFLSNAHPQITKPGKPESFQFADKKKVIIPFKILESIDTSYLIKDEIKKGIPNRYGIVQHLEINIKKEGVPTKIDDKGTIWQYEVKSKNAHSIGIRFKTFHLPEGASVFIYNEEHTQLAGAFTNLDNLYPKQLPIADFNGQNAIIEYFEPANTSFPGELIIGSIALAYKSPITKGPGRIGINCPEGANWQDAKHAVCLMSFNDSLYLYYCTGFLINNVREDGIPYFQTASHCLNSDSLAETLITYFNYENTVCSQDSVLYSPTIAGASIVATSSFSDFSLLLLSQYPPNDYLPYYAGWNANIEYAKSGTCIHHPSRAPKCISIDTLSPRNYPYSITWEDIGTDPNSEAGTHWEVVFSYGNVEGGSSGAPLFNENQRVIGQLHGGTNNDYFFGKFSVSWNHNNGYKEQLMHWLDPDSTGILSIGGNYLPRKPLSLFSANYTEACNGATVELQDESKYAATKWQWKITPSSFIYVNGTDSDSKKPEVVFTNEGLYNVTLITSNAYGSDTLLKSNYINSVHIRLSLSGLPDDKIVCGCNLNHYPLIGSGALTYIFKIERNDKISSSTKFDSTFLSLNPGQNKYGSFKSWVWITGTTGTCVRSDSTQIEISMPVNDDIENAIQLWPGTNNGYSNFCASVQKNEPHPPTSSCSTPGSWCPSPDNPDTVLRNTIWFRFLGPPTGMVSIDTHGLFDRIALYDADSSSQIMSGNPAAFKMVAANDDRSATDPTALLENIRVVPFKNYWLQVDGDNHATGSCSIDLLTNSIEVFPNPSSGIFTIIISNVSAGTADVKILSPIGTIVYSNSFQISLDANRFNFDFHTLSQGLYLIQAKINGAVSKAKLMLVK
jgi:PKD repeat protein